VIDGPRKRKASSRLLADEAAPEEVLAAAARAVAVSRPRSAKPRAPQAGARGGLPPPPAPLPFPLPLLQHFAPQPLHTPQAAPPPRSHSPQAAPPPRLPASFLLAAQWPSPPWGLPQLQQPAGAGGEPQAAGAHAVSPVACWPDAFVAQWQRPALAAARSPQPGGLGLLPSMGDAGALERSPAPGLYGWEPLHVYARPRPAAAQPARKKSRSGGARSGGRRKPRALPLADASGEPGAEGAAAAAGAMPRSRAPQPRSRARLPPPPPPRFGEDGALPSRSRAAREMPPAAPYGDGSYGDEGDFAEPAAGGRVRGSRAPRARRATAPRMRAAQPPPPPPAAAPVYDNFPPYNRQTVLRSMQSPLCDPLVDVAALLGAALAGGALTAAEAAQLVPLLPPAEQAAAAAGTEQAALLAAAVKAPAFCAAARDFSRLLVAGSWDPNAPRAGARMLDHYRRLLNEPTLRVALWATQRPAMGTRSRGAAAATAAASPLAVSQPPRRDEAPAAAHQDGAAVPACEAAPQQDAAPADGTLPQPQAAVVLEAALAQAA